MNFGIVIKVLGNLLTLESIIMIPSFIVAMINQGNDIKAFAYTILITAGIGIILSKIKARNQKIKAREAFAIVSFGWILASVFGSLPFLLSGQISNPFDAFFETVSGFTTTGATILSNVEAVDAGLLFWRSFTHWIGGMGILVFTLAILPTLGVGGFQIFKAESPGPINDKIAPKIKDTAKILYITYISLTTLQVLLLVCGGMDLYNSLIHTFGSLGTGGFSSKSLSVGYWNSTYLHMVIAVFLVLSGANFSHYYSLYKGKWRDVLKDEELRLYLGIITFSTIFIAGNLLMTSNQGIGLALRDSFFQTSSIITTTGYATVDFNTWPAFSKAILFLLMFVGGCAGSTGGSIKNIRILVLLKLIKREIAKIFHPRAMIPIKVGGKPVTSDTTAAIAAFFMLYILLFIFGTLYIAFAGYGIETSASATAATLGNIGPGFDIVGPMGNFSVFRNDIKFMLSLLMLCGRLELFTMIALFAPRNWKDEV